jgi:hypothetical protein
LSKAKSGDGPGCASASGLDAVANAGPGLRSLKDAWADTTTPHGRLMLTVTLLLALDAYLGWTFARLGQRFGRFEVERSRAAVNA